MPSQNEIDLTVQLANNGIIKGNKDFLFLYKKCKNLNECKSLNTQLEEAIFNEDCKILNKLTYAYFLLKYGRTNESLQVIDNFEPFLLDKNKYILAEYYSILGNIALRTETPELAISNFQKSLELYLQTEDNFYIQVNYMNLGRSYTAIQVLDTGIYYFSLAKSVQNADNEKNVIYIDLNIAVNMLNKGDLEKAKSIFLNSLEKLQISQDIYAEVRTLANIASVYFEQDSIQKSLDYYSKALIKATKNELITDKIRIYVDLSKLYKNNHDYQKAYTNLKKADSLKLLSNFNKASRSIVEHEKQYYIEIQKVKNEMQNKIIIKESRNKLLILIILFLISLAFIVVIKLYLSLKQKNKILYKQTLKQIKYEIQKSDFKTKSQNTETNNQIKEIIFNLETLIEEDELFYDRNLTLESLSKKINTNRSYLSQAINLTYNMSFLKWLNELRINKACNLMLDKDFDNYSLEGIANSVGYSTISTFNTNFKRVTGITPSYFRSNHTIQ